MAVTVKHGPIRPKRAYVAYKSPRERSLQEPKKQSRRKTQSLSVSRIACLYGALLVVVN